MGTILLQQIHNYNLDINNPEIIIEYDSQRYQIIFKRNGVILQKMDYYDFVDINYRNQQNMLVDFDKFFGAYINTNTKNDKIEIKQTLKKELDMIMELYKVKPNLFKNAFIEVFD